VGDAEKIKMLFVSEPGRMSLLDKLESNQSLNENEIQAMNSLLRTYVKEVSSREDLKKDKMVIQALCYASQSEAWMYTKKTEQQMIEGEKTLVTKVVASGTYGMRPKAAAPASFLVGGNYLSIMKLLNSVLILAQNEDLKLEDDKNLRRLLNDMSKSGMPTTMRQIRNAYKGACKNNNVTFYEE
jgi:ribosomal protein S20